VASLIQNPTASLEEYKEQGYVVHIKTPRHDFWMKPQICPPELWIIDQSSLVGTAYMLGILRAARQEKAARIVFVGDQSQHHAIKAGAPIRALIESGGLTLARLETIYRQKEAGLKQAVELSIDKPAESLDLLTTQGRVVELAEATARYQRIAADYVKNIKGRQNTLVVSLANDERRALNATIRQAMIEHMPVQ